METRGATATDVPEIRRIAREAVGEAYDFLPKREREATARERFSDERLESAMADDDAVLVAAVDGGDLVGFAHVDAATRVDSVGEGVLRGLYVAPNRWREGIGTALLEAVEDSIRERGFTQLSVPVLADNERGRRFLESNDFEKIEERVEDLFTGGTAPQLVYYHDFA
ncbi:GNAT family N-acetyltransferase [Haladaptatus salinisoli]|uniref:GNAT family N-acetyltransferase n=1 Tax=Haladaptatus salinisoli TaxID=2884876 RepID=UPI001D0A21CC|nr:GNAT family N-acetyltransferase [Haladaptatus salinisoli]